MKRLYKVLLCAVVKSMNKEERQECRWSKRGWKHKGE